MVNPSSSSLKIINYQVIFSSCPYTLLLTLSIFPYSNLLILSFSYSTNYLFFFSFFFLYSHTLHFVIFSHTLLDSLSFSSCISLTLSYTILLILFHSLFLGSSRTLCMLYLLFSLSTYSILSHLFLLFITLCMPI